MTSLLTRPTQFTSFGPSLLSRQTRGKLTRHRLPTDRLECRKLLREECPRVPGVYGWLDRDQQLIYVGKSKSLRMRLLSYFAKTPSDPKMGRIRQHSHQLVWEQNSHELLALIREQELIHRWRPDFNKQGQPTRTQPAFVCISSGPAPNAFLARRATKRAMQTFGPISGTQRLREAIIALNMTFGLRDCPDKTKFEFNNQRQLFDNPQTAKCIRYELGSCPGPCAGNCSTRDYQRNVDQALDFLNGKSRSILDKLDSTMDSAAKNCAFERAAQIRDFRNNLGWLDRRLTMLRQSETILNGVVPVSLAKKRTAWMVLRGGRLIATATRPDRPVRAAKAVRVLRETSERPCEMPANLLEMNLQLIVLSWFKKHPEMREQLLNFETAIEFCNRKIQRISA